MGKPIWGLWARFLGIGSALCIVPGGIIGLWYPAFDFFLPYYAIGVGVFVILWELPFPGLMSLGFIFKNLYVRAILYFLMSGPLFMDAPTTTGGLTLLTTSIAYFIGAIRGESYRHPSTFVRNHRRNMKQNETDQMKVVNMDFTDQPAIPEHSRVYSS